MSVNIAAIWIRVIPAPGQDVKTVAFVKLTTAVLYQHFDAVVHSDLRHRYVKSQNAMYANRIHVKMVARANWKHWTITFVYVLKDIPVNIHYFPPLLPKINLITQIGHVISNEQISSPTIQLHLIVFFLFN